MRNVESGMERRTAEGAKGAEGGGVEPITTFALSAASAVSLPLPRGSLVAGGVDLQALTDLAQDLVGLAGVVFERPARVDHVVGNCDFFGCRLLGANSRKRLLLRNALPRLEPRR